MPLYALDGVAPEVPHDGRFWVAPNATIVGNVQIGIDASIWFGAVVRGDNEPIRVGERSNIQDLVLIHSDPGYPASIGSDCTIGHRAVVHGCMVGDNCLIGMGGHRPQRCADRQQLACRGRRLGSGRGRHTGEFFGCRCPRPRGAHARRRRDRDDHRRRTRLRRQRETLSRWIRAALRAQTLLRS